MRAHEVDEVMSWFSSPFSHLAIGQLEPQWPLLCWTDQGFTGRTAGIDVISSGHTGPTVIALVITLLATNTFRPVMLGFEPLSERKR